MDEVRPMVDTNNHPLAINQQYIIRRNVTNQPVLMELLEQDFADGENVFRVVNIEYDEAAGVNNAWCTFSVNNVIQHQQWYSEYMYTFERIIVGGRRKSRRLRKRFRRTRK